MTQTQLKQSLSTADIENILALRESQKALKARLDLIVRALDTAENKIVQSIESGADLAHCRFSLSIHEISRRYPAWKEHFISHCGKVEADQVLESTTPTIHKKLEIK